MSDPVPGTYPIDTGEAVLRRDPVNPAAFLLEINGVPSSHIVPGDPEALAFEYMDWMARIVDAVLPAGSLSALHLGAGACSLPRALAAGRPGSRQIAVDTDGRLLTLVREWFALPRSPELKLRQGDGAQQLAGFPDGRFDLVIRDAFSGDSTPAALSDDAFFAHAARVTHTLFLANIADVPPQRESKAEVRRLMAHFPHVFVAADPGQLRGRRRGNIIAAASHEAFDLAILAGRLRSGPAQARVVAGPEFAG